MPLVLLFFQGLKPGTYYMDAAKPSDGYDHSIFAFYIMPLQEKPRVLVGGAKPTDAVIIRLGLKPGFLHIKVKDQNGSPIAARVVLYRADSPGSYKRSISGDGLVPVTAVPITVDIEAEGFNLWSIKKKPDDLKFRLQPGELVEIEAVLSRLSSAR